MLLNKLGVGLDTVRAALTAANANSPKGEFSDAMHAWTIRDNDQMFRSEQYRNLIVAYNNGAPVRLADVAMSRTQSKIFIMSVSPQASRRC